MHSAEGVVLKIKSVFIWTVCLVILVLVHGMTDPTSASVFVNVTPTSLSFQGTAGGATQTAGINVANMSNYPVNISWTYSANWLVDVKPGLAMTIQPGQVAAFNFTASTAGLAAGTYTGTATVSNQQGGSIMQVPLTLTVTSGNTAPTLGVSPTNMSFSATVGGNPASKTLSIANTGGGTFGWSAFDDAQWMTLSTQAGSNNGSVTVNVNSASLAAGTYNGTISIYTNVYQMKSIPVSLTVTAAGTGGGGGSTTPTTGSATLNWSPSPSSNISGYRIYSATSPGQYSTPIAILGNVTSYQATGLRTNTTYFFVVTAVDGTGKESLYSNEVYKTVY